jgi:5-methylcytosine-specific restriction endonuclease McrA
MASVVVLTQRYLYWGERSIRDAIKLYFRGKIEILKADESKVIKAGVSKEGVRIKIPAPLVVRLVDFAGYKIKKDKIDYSDDAVYERDRSICQFWHTNEDGERFKYRCTKDERTIDHVIPRSRGGDTSFTNCVCACKHCNNKIKKNRTPEEAGLKLIREPKAPVLRKGDMAIITFTFDPKSKAHNALNEYMGVQFSSVVS